MPCTILSFGDHQDHYVGRERSSCFYFPTMDLTKLAANVAASGKRFVGRAARIEVSDEKALLHAHPGATIAFITSGSGVLKSDAGEQRVRAGDTIYIPPNTAHLSIADGHTSMTEWIVYLGAEDDRQTLLEA